MAKHVYLGDPRDSKGKRIYTIDEDVWESSAKPTDPDSLYELSEGITAPVVPETMGGQPIEVFHNGQWSRVNKTAFLHPYQEDEEPTMWDLGLGKYVVFPET